MAHGTPPPRAGRGAFKDLSREKSHRSARSSSTGFPADKGAQRDGETKGEVPARRSRARGALHLDPVPAAPSTSIPCPRRPPPLWPTLWNRRAGTHGDGLPVFTDLTGGGRKSLRPGREGESRLLPV